MEDLINFKRKILKVDGPRKHKIRNSWGVYDCYKYYRKNKPEGKEYIMTESQYFAIIRHINNILAKQLSRGNSINLPCRMGTLELRKYDKVVKIGEDGKVHTNLPIDWDKTLELWYNDEESRNNKTLVRIESKDLFKLILNRTSANYENKSFYEFIFNKDLKRTLKQNIKDGMVDALIFNRDNYVE